MKLTDIQVHERLIAASDALPKPNDVETVKGRTAVETARRVLVALQLAVLTGVEQRSISKD